VKLVSQPHFSVIVNTYHRAHSLSATLAALAGLRWPLFEIIIVTGPSEDNTCEVVAKWANSVKHISCTSVNLSQSRNIGLAHANGDWVVFTDDDALPEPDWLCQLAAHVIAHQHVKLGAVGGFVYDHTGHAYQAEYLISNLFGNTSVNEVQANRFPFATDKDSLHYPSLMGVNVCYSRAALQQIGGFDQAYAYFLEETDLILRLVKHGWQIHNQPLARVHHKYANSHIRLDKKISSFYHIMRSRAYFSTRHALPILGQDAVAKQNAQWLEEIRTHYPHLLSEAYYGLCDGINMAQERAVIPSVQPSCSTWLPVMPLLSPQKRLRLLLVAPEFPPRKQGGIARFMQTLAQTLAEQGHEITVITEAEATLPATVDRVDNYWVHRIHPLNDDELTKVPSASGLPELPQQILGFSAAVWLEAARIQSSRQFQAAIAGLWDVPTSHLVAHRLLPVFTYLVTSYHHMAQHSQWDEDFVRIMLNAEKWLLSQTKLIASSQAIANDTAIDTQIKLVHSASIIPFGLPNVASVELTDLVSENVSSSLNLLYVGRFEYRKGIDLLLDITPLLLKQYPQLSITFIGKDDLTWQAGEPIKSVFCKNYPQYLNRLTFLGEVDESALHRAYQACDLLVAPSRYESFGLIYLEAMRAGKPCVGTRSGGIPEVVQHGVTGLLAWPNDSDSLYFCISELLADQSLREKMGAAGLHRFDTQFTADIFAKRLISYLQQRLCLVD
jgi:hypothetical protein